MSRYIDVDVLKNKITEVDDGCAVNGTGFDIYTSEVFELIDEVPSADVVEVIKCENCKHGYFFINTHTDNYGTSVQAKNYCVKWQDWVPSTGYCFLADKR